MKDYSENIKFDNFIDAIIKGKVCSLCFHLKVTFYALMV